MSFWSTRTRSKPARSVRSTRLSVEVLESRLAPATVRLDIVALHEFGHSLGLAHTSNGSIMDSYYNANYDLNNFANDPSALAIQALYGDDDLNDGAWKDSLDANPGDGKVEIKYSFMPDGVKLDSGAKNTLNATMNKYFGSPSVWKPIFAAQLDRWASVTNGRLVFTEVSDGTYNFNVNGQPQNDARFGDIRIGSHRMDGAGRTLAHAYYPPPNGTTGAGDAHFDQAETWVLASGGSTTTGGAGGGKKGALTDGDDHDGHGHNLELAPDEFATATTASAEPSPATFIGIGLGESVLNSPRVVDSAPGRYGESAPLPTAALPAVNGPSFIAGWLGGDETEPDEEPAAAQSIQFSAPVFTMSASAPQWASGSMPLPVFAPAALPANEPEQAVPQPAASPAVDVHSFADGSDPATLAAFAVVLAGGLQWNAQKTETERRPKALLV